LIEIKLFEKVSLFITINIYYVVGKIIRLLEFLKYFI
jgi:hypothetical protein